MALRGRVIILQQTAKGKGFLGIKLFSLLSGQRNTASGTEFRAGGGVSLSGQKREQFDAQEAFAFCRLLQYNDSASERHEV